MKVGIYGGSFNPPHLGHLKLAETIVKKANLDSVIVIPSGISPQKDDNGNIDPKHRINMCKLTFTDDIFFISDMEILRGGKSYTFDTINLIKEKYPDDELYLFMGSDMLLSFHTWYRPSEILKNCRICAVSRNKDDSEQKLRDYVSETLKTDRVTVYDITPFDVSSSEIREKIKHGENCSDLLTEQALQYIKDNKLYG